MRAGPSAFDLMVTGVRQKIKVAHINCNLIISHCYLALGNYLIEGAEELHIGVNLIYFIN